MLLDIELSPLLRPVNDNDTIAKRKAVANLGVGPWTLEWMLASGLGASSRLGGAASKNNWSRNMQLSFSMVLATIRFARIHSPRPEYSQLEYEIWRQCMFRSWSILLSILPIPKFGSILTRRNSSQGHIKPMLHHSCQRT